MSNQNHENATLDSSGRDPFGSKPELTPARPGGDWDAGADAELANVREDADPSEVLSDAEDQSWQHDPDAEIEAADRGDDDNQETRPSEDPEEASASAEEDPGEVAPQGASQRAQERIQELAAEKRVANERAAKLEQALTALLEAQQRQVQFQEQDYSARNAKLEAEKAQQSEAALLARFKALGLREDSTADWLAFEAIMKAERVEQRALAREQEIQKSSRESQYRLYQDNLRKSLEEQAERFKVPKEDREDLYKQAYAVARAEQLKDPAEAAARVLKPYSRIKPAPETTRRPNAKDPVHQAISARGRAAERKPGDSASGRPQKRSIEDIERSMGVGKRW